MVLFLDQRIVQLPVRIRLRREVVGAMVTVDLQEESSSNTDSPCSTDGVCAELLATSRSGLQYRLGEQRRTLHRGGET